MSVKDRIKLFISSQNMTVSAFETSISASNGYVNSISRSIGIEKLVLIIEKYPNLNIVWLLTGKGDMTYSDSSVSEPGVNYSVSCPRCKDKDTIIALLEEKNEDLKLKIAKYEKSPEGKNEHSKQTG